VKGRNRYVNSRPHSVCEGKYLFFAQLINNVPELTMIDDLFQVGLDHVGRAARLVIIIHHSSNPSPNLYRCPAKMCFQDLPGIHPGGNAERVEDNVDRCPVSREWHILLGKNDRHDSLVSVATGNLVTYSHLSFHGHINLDCPNDT